MRAWVIFTGKTDIGWLKCLKPGFRHCFAVIEQQGKWITYDPLSAHTDIQVNEQCDTHIPLPLIFYQQGETVLPATVIERGHTKSAPVMPYSCVEAIKRLLGIHKRTIITPYQLYQHLKETRYG